MQLYTLHSWHHLVFITTPRSCIIYIFFQVRKLKSYVTYSSSHIRKVLELQASTGSQSGCSCLPSKCLVSGEHYSMGIPGISMQTCKWDPNNDIQILKVAQKQAVLCGFIFLSWFSICGATATKDKLGPAQTPEMKKLTYASVRKNNVMGVGEELSSGMKIVHSRGNLSCHIISEIISLLPASPSEILLQWLPYCSLSK